MAGSLAGSTSGGSTIGPTGVCNVMPGFALALDGGSPLPAAPWAAAMAAGLKLAMDPIGGMGKPIGNLNGPPGGPNWPKLTGEKGSESPLPAVPLTELTVDAGDELAERRPLKFSGPSRLL